MEAEDRGEGDAFRNDQKKMTLIHRVPGISGRARATRLVQSKDDLKTR